MSRLNTKANITRNSNAAGLAHRHNAKDIQSNTYERKTAVVSHGIDGLRMTGKREQATARAKRQGDQNKAGTAVQKRYSMSQKAHAIRRWLFDDKSRYFCN